MNTPSNWNSLKELSGWDPFREMDEMQRRLSRFLNEGTARRGNGNEALTVAEWAPLVDILEDDKGYLIKAELPEVRKGDVKVRVENGVLSVSGERHFEKDEKGKRYHRVERAYGSFNRSFTLPDDVDSNEVQAEFKDGVLNVRVGKDKSARPKSIDVKVA